MKKIALVGMSVVFLAIGACDNDTKNNKQISETAKKTVCIEGGNVYQNGQMVRAVITIKNGRIASVGKYENCDGLKNTGSVHKLDGAYIYPGFIDSHAHLLGIGLREMTLNLEGTKSIKDLQEKIKQAVKGAKKGELVYGRGWIETHWPEARFPTAKDLDLVSPDNPVVLQRADGHAMVVNSLALKQAGIDKNTKDPFGGQIIKDNNGNPDGMLIDKAMELLQPILTEPDINKRRAAYIKGSEVYASYGWTGIQTMSANAKDVKMLEELSDKGLLKIRVYPAVDLSGADDLLADIAKNGARKSKNGRVVTRGIKLYADGALGSRGAALLAPYSDDPNNKGLLLTNKEKIMPILQKALQDGIQVSIHAIGDRGNRKVLDWIEEAYNSVPISERKVKQPRWRIEHAQILNPDDISRLSKLKLIASMQPSHAIGDLYFAVDRLGVERLEGGYAWKTISENGVVIAGGSDAPVEKGDPRIELYAAIARKGLDGFSGAGWYPQEKLPRAATIDLFTKNAAYAAFAENELGKIQIGYKADFSVFDKDILSIPPKDILDMKPVMTMLDGEIMYKTD